MIAQFKQAYDASNGVDLFRYVPALLDYDEGGIR
jgi:hypothetical protein